MRATLSIALMATFVLGSALALGCSSTGSDNETTASLIHRLLLAAGTETSGELESYTGRLPDGLPKEPPLYPDAKLVISARQPAPSTAPQDATPSQTPRPMLYFIVLDTPDDRSDVYGFYENALDEEPWQVEASFSSEQLDTLQFNDTTDTDITGAVSIAPGGEDGRTTILISLQDAGAFVEEPPPYQLQESLAVPSGFPPDVPIYDGATVTQTAFLREPQMESYLLVFLTTDSQEDVRDFYTEAFQNNGWTVLPGTPFGLEERLDFRDEPGDIQGQLAADRFAEDDSYTEVRLQVQTKPGRQPSTTPTPGEEPDGSVTPGATPSQAP